MMCAYNRVNGTYSCENRRLLNDILKEELDFQVGSESCLSKAHGAHWIVLGFHVVGLDCCRVTLR